MALPSVHHDKFLAALLKECPNPSLTSFLCIKTTVGRVTESRTTHLFMFWCNLLISESMFANESSRVLMKMKPYMKCDINELVPLQQDHIVWFGDIMGQSHLPCRF